MPRVNHVKRSRKSPGTCMKCGKEILASHPYRWWKFRYGGKRVVCMDTRCRPRPSDLTRAKWGSILAAMESVEDASWDGCEVSDIKDALENVVLEANDVAEEYRELDDMQPRPPSADEAMEWADEIENWMQDLENWEPEELEDEEATQEDKDQHFQDQLEAVFDLFSQFPL